MAQAPTGGYCDATPCAFQGLENSSSCGEGNSDIAFKFEMGFGTSNQQVGLMSIQFGSAFGKGGAVYLDGTLLTATPEDLWLAGNHSATGKIFSVQHMANGAGNQDASVVRPGRRLSRPEQRAQRLADDAD